MQLRKLYRTIENLAQQPIQTEEELLKHVLRELVGNEEIGVKGGRLWKFEPRTGTYVLLDQVGDIDLIKKDYRVKIKDYPLFYELTKSRTVLGSEQDQYLRKQGILKYSATGIGEKVQWRGNSMFRYVLAFNADTLNENLTSTLNIISAAVSSVLRSRRMERKAQVLERDLDKAREIQKSILPQHEMTYHSFEMYGVSVPHQIVGGDFFDYLQAEGDHERVGVVIGDAASKGISAAVQALYTSGALRMGFEYHTKISFLLSRVNKLLNKTFSEEHFVSLFYCELTQDRNGVVLYANCGHNNPILVREKGSHVEYIEATGQMLGPFPESVFRTESLFMNKGDIMCLYTDGISEATNERGEFYGEDRIVDLIRLHAGRSPKEITQILLEDVQKFNSLGTQSDDKTVVTIKRR
jgi:sigma-B regulation protein RsbU (phosphoserine phosphatase)